MRVRSRDSRQNVAIESTMTQGPQFNRLIPYIGPANATARSGSMEYISDTERQWDSDNPCYHLTEDWVIHPARNFQITWNGENPGLVGSGSLAFPVTYGSIYYLAAIIDSHGYIAQAPTAEPSSTWSSIPDYAWEGWSNIYPVIRDELGLLNSIYELKDFRKLPQLLRNTRNGIKALTELSSGLRWVSQEKRKGELRLIYELMGKTTPGVWSSLLNLKWTKLKKLSLSEMISRLITVGKVAPEHFLNWKFAVQPLLRDMAALNRAASTTKQQVDSLLARADPDVIHKTHWSTTLRPDELGLPAETTVDSGIVSGGTGTGRHVVTYEYPEGIKYTFTGRYSFSYPEETRRLAYELGALDGLGMTMSAANLWNAAPWTFVIDWFVRIGPWLETFTPHHLEPVVHFHGACHSLKHCFDTCVWGTPYVPSLPTSYSYWGLEPRKMQSRKQSVYVRKSVVPFVSLPKTSDFSTMEKLLALALGLSSVRYSTL